MPDLFLELAVGASELAGYPGFMPDACLVNRYVPSARLDELVLAYATTIQESQGSEYLAVVIPLTTQRYARLARNLLYTGVTRGKRLVVLIGQRRALAIAVKNQDGRRRWSKLREWLAPEVAT